MRAIIDTNVIISAFLFPNSIPRRVLNYILTHDTLLMSEGTFDELFEVLYRRKFDKYITYELRNDFLDELTIAADLVVINEVVRECADPKDNKFLEVAINGNADLIVTGDSDLLILNPFRGIQIISPASFISLHT